MSQEFVPPHTIEYRHVIAAIPGDTLRQKYDWVHAHLAAVRALGEIDGVIQSFRDRLSQDSSMVYCVDDMFDIADIVDGVE